MKISMPRGDIRQVSFVVTGDPEIVSSITFDEIYFTVKKSFRNAEFLFQKKLSDGSIEKIGDCSYMFTIESSDTDNLSIGSYVFDIELISGSDIKQTSVGTLELTNEVTFASNEV